MFLGLFSCIFFFCLLGLFCLPILLLQGLSGLTFLRVLAVIIAFRIHPLLSLMVAIGGLYRKRPKNY